MALTTVPNPLLTTTAKRLTAADLKRGQYAELIATMRKEMLENNGIGLAANQIGRSESLFVIEEKLAIEFGVSSVYANPEITEYGTESDDMEEGCLSIPGFWVDIRRSKKIMFKALDGDGNKVKFRARGMLARVLQHETDHLNGLTIRDRSQG
jgi:peptide deformylase